jgi:hypothetical protein
MKTTRFELLIMCIFAVLFSAVSITYRTQINFTAWRFLRNIFAALYEGLKLIQIAFSFSTSNWTPKNVSILNTIANVPHTWLYESAVRAMCKKLLVSSDGGDSASKECKWCYWRRLWFVRRICNLVVFLSIESGGRFCGDAIDRNLISIPVKTFSR